MSFFAESAVPPPDKLVPPPESNLRSVPPPVKIDPNVGAQRYKHLLEQIHEGKITLADLQVIQNWFAVDRYAPKNTKWKKVFREGIKLVSFDKEPQTILNRDESATGMDLDEWWRVYQQLTQGKQSARDAAGGTRTDIRLPKLGTACHGLSRKLNGRAACAPPLRAECLADRARRGPPPTPRPAITRGLVAPA